MSDKLTISSDQSVEKQNSKIENDDNIWVNETLKGNQDAFGKIMHKFYPPLSRYIRRIVGSSLIDIEDILQNTFIKVYKNLNDYDETQSFSSWIYRIAHNEAIDTIRKNGIKQNKFQYMGSYEDGEDLMMNIADEDADFIAEIDRKIAKGKILEMLSEMKDHYRDVLILRYLENMEYNEISDILKVPLGTVATLLHRARKEFRKIVIRDKFEI